MVERLMAMVATSGPAVNAPKAVERALRSRLAKSDGEPFFARDELEGGGGGYAITIAGVSIAVLAFPFGIPVDTLGTAVGGEYIWKEAGDVFLASGGHFLLSVLNPEHDPGERFGQARVLTMVTAAVLSAAKGAGVFWQAADCVISPERFLKEAKTVGIDEFASPLWFGFRFFPGSSEPQSRLLICQSRGLAAFLGREIECGPYEMTPGEMAETVVTLARFMATEGAVFAEGHTFGTGGEPQGRIFFDWSTLGGVNQPIFQLRLRAQEMAEWQ